MADIGIRVVVTGIAEARRNIGAIQSDINNLEKTIRGVSGVTSAFGQKMTQVGSAIAGVGRTLTIAVTAPIAAIGVSALEAGVQFESAFAGIGKTVEGVMTSTGQLTALGQEIRDEFRQMALEIPIATNELARLGEVVGQLGVSADEVSDVTRTIAMLGATTELSAEDAAAGLIRFGNIAEFAGLTTEEFMRRAGSALVALGNSSVSTEGEILNLSLRLAAAGDRANFSSQEIMAWATTLSDLGVRAEMGGTAVSRAITEMLMAVQTGGEGIEEFAHISGRGVEQFRQDFEEDASKALLRFITNLEAGIRTGRVNEEMLRNMGLSGVRAIDVIGRLGDAQTIFSKNLNTANSEWDRALALQEEFNKRAATVESQIQILKNQFADLGITIFDLVRDDLVRLVEFIGTLIDRFKQLDPETQKTILMFAAIAAAIGPVLIIIGGLVAALGTIITAIGALLSPVGLAVGAVGLLGGALAAAFAPEIVAMIQSVIDKFKEFLGLSGGPTPIAEAPSGATGDPMEDFAARHPGAGGAAAVAEPSGLTQMMDRLRATFETIRQRAAEFRETINGIIDRIRAFVEESGALEVVSNAWRILSDIIGNVFSSAFETVITTALPKLREAFDQLTQALNRFGIDWGDVFNVAVTAISVFVILVVGLIVLLIGIVTGLVTAVAGAVEALARHWNNVSLIFKSALDAVQQVIIGFIQFFQGIIQGDFGLIIEGIKNMFQGMLQFSIAIWAMLGENIRFMVDLILSIVGGLIEGIIFFFQDLFDQLVGSSIVPDMVNAIIQWITTLSDTVLQLISELVQMVIDKITEWKDKAVALVTEMVNAISRKITMMRDDIVNAITQIREHSNRLTEGFQKFLNWLQNNAARLIEFAGAIAGAFAAIPASMPTNSPQFQFQTGWEMLAGTIQVTAAPMVSELNSIAGAFGAISALNMPTMPVSTSSISNITEDNSMTFNGDSATVNEEINFLELMLQRAQMRRH